AGTRTHREIGRQGTRARARTARLRLGARGRVMVSLPTNRDENWRYANLRPLAKANVADAQASLGAQQHNLPERLAGYERWIFCDGHFSGSDPQPDVRLKLLDARVAGESFAAMLDTDLASAGIDFALARINAARGDDVLQIEL